MRPLSWFSIHWTLGKAGDRPLYLELVFRVWFSASATDFIIVRNFFAFKPKLCKGVFGTSSAHNGKVSRFNLAGTPFWRRGRVSALARFSWSVPWRGSGFPAFGFSKMLLPPCLWLCGGPFYRWSSTQGKRFINMLSPNIYQKPPSFYNLRWMHGIDAVRKLMTSSNWTKLCGIWDAEMHMALNDSVFQAPVCMQKNPDHTSVFPAKLDQTPFSTTFEWYVQNQGVVHVYNLSYTVFCSGQKLLFAEMSLETKMPGPEATWFSRWFCFDVNPDVDRVLKSNQIDMFFTMVYHGYV